MAIILIAFIAAGILFHALGFRVNLTESIPIGLYRITKTGTIKNAYVIFCPDDRASFKIALDRGYIDHGLYCEGYGYLMKKVVAVSGNMISVNSDGVFVNQVLIPYSKPKLKDGMNRKLPQWQVNNHQLKDDEVMTMTSQSEWSFDGRYYGLVRSGQIKGIITPIWVRRKQSNEILVQLVLFSHCMRKQCTIICILKLMEKVMSIEKTEKQESNKVLLFVSPMTHNDESLIDNPFTLKMNKEGMVDLMIVKPYNKNTIKSASDEEKTFDSEKTGYVSDFNESAFTPLLAVYKSDNNRIILGVLIDRKYLDTKECDIETWSKTHPKEYEDKLFIQDHLEKNKYFSCMYDTTWRCMQSKDIGVFQLPADEMKVLGAIVIKNDNNNKRTDMIYLNKESEKIVKPCYKAPIHVWQNPNAPKTLREFEDTGYFCQATEMCYSNSLKRLLVDGNDFAYIDHSIKQNPTVLTQHVQPLIDSYWQQTFDVKKMPKEEFRIIQPESIKKFTDTMKKLRDEERGTDAGFKFK